MPHKVEPTSKPYQSLPKGRTFSYRFAAAVRWLHIYISLFAFTALVFFGLTGITLNHPTWFGVEMAIVEHAGELRAEWLPVITTSAPDDSIDVEAGVDKLEIVEYLRATHALRGAVSEFRIDERECLILFKGPGYSADVVADRESGTYKITETQMGAVAILNDLHKGRDTGAAWSLVIDFVSLLTVFVSITGLLLIFYLRRKRLAGLLMVVIGTVVIVVVATCLIP